MLDIEAELQAIEKSVEAIEKSVEVIRRLITSPQPPTAPVQQVDSIATFNDAITTASGGEVFTFQPGEYNEELRIEQTFDTNVTVSARGAVFNNLLVRKSTNITLIGAKFLALLDMGWRKSAGYVEGSRNVVLDSCIFSGDPTTRAARALTVKGSVNVVVNGCELCCGEHGGVVRESERVMISNNEFHHNAGDNFRIAKDCEDITVSNNTFRFLDPTNPNNIHQDHIQVFTTNASKPTRNVVIEDNRIWQPLGYTQSIFIRSHDSTTKWLNNFIVSGNVILNGHKHGISVYNVDQCTITGNRVLWNGEDVGFRWNKPFINTSGKDIRVENNVAMGYALKGKPLVEQGNVIATVESLPVRIQELE